MCQNPYKLKITFATDSCSEGNFIKMRALIQLHSFAKRNVNLINQVLRKGRTIELQLAVYNIY